MDHQDLDQLVDKIADAVVDRLEERRKIRAIAEYVIAEVEKREQGCGAPEAQSDEARPSVAEGEHRE